MITTRLFRSNRTQAVRLPQSVAFQHDGEVVVTVEGTARVILPVAHSWDRLFDLCTADGSTFPERDQPDDQERPAL